MSARNILLVLTGGTICSFEDENGERSADTAKARTLIVRNFRESGSMYSGEDKIGFTVDMPLNILSENMTVTHWNTLINALKKYDLSRFDGVIILHGTDTLAYTASLLSLLMAGTPVPVFLVSAQQPLYMPDTNGNDNFRAAAELIAGGIVPNIYVVYGNHDGMYLHYGAHLFQCANRRDEFFSPDAMFLNGAVPTVKAAPKREMLLYSVHSLLSCVLRIAPYAGLDYRWFSLDGVRAVLHGTYHSCTVAVQPYGDEVETSHSLTWLKKKCDERNIPLFIEPCNEEAYNYYTTGDILRAGAKPLCRMTGEMTYVKLLCGCSMGLEGRELRSFLDREINGEFVYEGESI